MRFFISSELKRNDFLKIIIFFTLLFFLFLWITNVLLYMQIGFSYNSIVEFYLGNEETFRPPKSYIGAARGSSFSFFLYGNPARHPHTPDIVHIGQLRFKTRTYSCLFYLDLYRNYQQLAYKVLWTLSFAYLKLFSFFVMQISLLLMMGIIVIYLFKKDD